MNYFLRVMLVVVVSFAVACGSTGSNNDTAVGNDVVADADVALPEDLAQVDVADVLAELPVDDVSVDVAEVSVDLPVADLPIADVPITDIPVDVPVDVAIDTTETNQPDIVDNTAPVVYFGWPTDGRNVSGTVAVEVVATDVGGVNRVEISVNGELASTLTTSPYLWDWDTSLLADGYYVLTATAWDESDNSKSVDVTVTVGGPICGTTVFFDVSQGFANIASGVNTDTIASNGYLFTYTRDKLFTGGVGMTEPIGRTVRVPWPQGIEAQAITVGPNMGGSNITIERVDGGLFDMTTFTYKLLANTSPPGAQVEIMPILDGEDAFNDPAFFDATGFYGISFAYDETDTAVLRGFEKYKVDLWVDFAFTAITLTCQP